jgi:tRNA threonylcarbamoyladenosine biosynthesis protein TsaE
MLPLFDSLATSSTVLSSSPEDTLQFGKRIASQLIPGSILCLHGDLGAGKTLFSKGIISFLTDLHEDAIQSPTFIYLNLYETSACSLCHFDLYRLSSDKEFQDKGFLDYFDGSSICLIEWPCRITSLIPPHAIEMHFSSLGDTQRSITITPGRQS